MIEGSSIFIAGHTGLVGSAILRALNHSGQYTLITASRSELDLTNQDSVNRWFAQEKPDYVFLAAAKVGGILANKSFKGEFIHQNLMIQSNVIHSAYTHGCRKLLFLGSSCIYPKHAQVPIREDQLLTGPLEETNDAYAIAKIAGHMQCKAYAQQYGFNAISLMPTNLYLSLIHI